MIIKIINSILILVLVFMVQTSGFAMLTGKPEMLEMFCKWNFSHTVIIINVSVTMISAFLILFPGTFVLGNFYAGQWGAFDVFFKFTINNKGKVSRLDIGQGK